MPSLTPAARYYGARGVTYEQFSAELKADSGLFQILLRLVSPGCYGSLFLSDVAGNPYEISGLRTSTSYGNNLANAGVDRLFGTADDIWPGTPGHVVNSQGRGAEFWANAESPFLRLTRPQWGADAQGVEELGRPRGYEGPIAVDRSLRLVEPVTQPLANARLVSNALGAQSGPMPNPQGWNEYDMSFGQYVDHGLDFLARSGLKQSMAAATAPGDRLHAISGGAVGVVGDRGSQVLRDPVTRTLVPVANFSAGPNGGPAGLYAYTIIPAGKPTPTSDLPEEGSLTSGFDASASSHWQHQHGSEPLAPYSAAFHPGLHATLPSEDTLLAGYSTAKVTSTVPVLPAVTSAPADDGGTPQFAPAVLALFAFSAWGTNDGEVMTATSQNSYLNGRGGNDYLRGGLGNDMLVGGDGDDVLSGGDGDDLLAGEIGDDVLTGGAGRDGFFYISAYPGHTDRITDFQPGSDFISLHHALVNTNGIDNASWSFIGAEAFSGKPVRSVSSTICSRSISMATPPPTSTS